MEQPTWVASFQSPPEASFPSSRVNGYYPLVYLFPSSSSCPPVHAVLLAHYKTSEPHAKCADARCWPIRDRTMFPARFWMAVGTRWMIDTQGCIMGNAVSRKVIRGWDRHRHRRAKTSSCVSDSVQPRTMEQPSIKLILLGPPNLCFFPTRGPMKETKACGS